MTELEPVDRIPDSAIEGGSTVEFIGDGRLIVKWLDDDGTVYSEEYERVGSAKKAVEEVDA